MIEKMNENENDIDKKWNPRGEPVGVKRLYPILPDPIHTDGPSFRLKKTDDIFTRLEGEEKHYAGVRKRYKRAQTIFQNICVGAGSLSIILSMSGLGTSLSGFGIVVGVPVGVIGGLCGLLSVGAGSYSKKLGKKVSKHEQTMIVAKSKINSIKLMVSNALRDEKMTDAEFEAIMLEADRFEELKQEIRSKFRINKGVKEKKDGLRAVSESYVDLLRREIQETLIKRLQPSAPPESDFDKIGGRE